MSSAEPGRSRSDPRHTLRSTSPRSIRRLPLRARDRSERDPAARPRRQYVPKAGDILLLSDPDPLFNVLYVIARSGRPGHCALVVTMPDGRPGMLEDGFSFTPFARVTPLDYAMNLYAGHVWVRQRVVPLTPEEDRRLTEFAVMADGGPYNTRKYRLAADVLPLPQPDRHAVRGQAGRPRAQVHVHPDRDGGVGLCRIG